MNIEDDLQSDEAERRLCDCYRPNGLHTMNCDWSRAVRERNEPREIIAAGIRQYCSDLACEYGYHEPHHDLSILQRVHDDTDSIADYIINRKRPIVMNADDIITEAART